MSEPDDFDRWMRGTFRRELPHILDPEQHMASTQPLPYRLTLTSEQAVRLAGYLLELSHRPSATDAPSPGPTHRHTFVPDGQGGWRAAGSVPNGKGGWRCTCPTCSPPAPPATSAGGGGG